MKTGPHGGGPGGVGMNMDVHQDRRPWPAWPARFQADGRPRILCAGREVTVLTVYQPAQRLQLYSLAELVVFPCRHCREWCETAIVAIVERALICPPCYATAIGLRRRENAAGNLCA
ncbi:hypothetical protein FPZ12_014150 [Amycolatopsis acidicola]|uniref:Uncharacterized protein n=1 Tax=Amycolatopsis acidicola TaxID=2596893 RepID=A0A5N0V7F4_9PSEU|nr:hypothetical protein [Amycolatopsis acidicola]KAA9161644.1 hypothetical protein FPZ12_014150 [Amycolatopsis acidicola]